MKKNDEFEINITDMGNDGEGIGKYDGMTFFIKGAVIGDRVLAGVTKLKKTFGYARMIRVLKPSEYRTVPPCGIASRCGGCQLQALDYGHQLEYKQNKVMNALIRLGGINAERIQRANENIPGNQNRETTSGSLSSENVSENQNRENISGNLSSENTSDIQSSEAVIFHDIIGMERPYNYRNKGQFPVGADKCGKTVTGFYAGHTHSIIDTESCMIQHKITDYIMRAVREYMTGNDIMPYDENGKGLVRHVLTRVGFSTHEVMVCVVINGKKLPAWEKLKKKLEDAIDEYNRAGGDESESEINSAGENAAEAGKNAAEAEKNAAEAGKNADCIWQSDNNVEINTDLIIKNNSVNCMKKDNGYRLESFSININTENTNVILGDEVVTLAGKPYITDYIGETKYRISPLSFYQVNPVQTRVLYSKALEYAGADEEEHGRKPIIWDLYCGIGTISLFLAKNAEKVYGVEIVPQAVEDAKANALMNGITNAEFFTGAAEDVVPEKYSEHPEMKGDVIVVDPPRKGCDEKLLETVCKMNPKRIVYVSCDPATLARDIAYLEKSGYLLKEVQPVDQFPFSGHVETVVSFVQTP